MTGERTVERLFRRAAKLRVLRACSQSSDVVTIDHSRSPFPCVVIVVAVEIDSFDVIHGQSGMLDSAP
jgi:hypothetical protein